MPSDASQKWDNVNVLGSTVEVISTGQYFKISGRELLRRLSGIVVAKFLLASWATFAWYKSIEEWRYEEVVSKGLAILEGQAIPRAFYNSAGRFPSVPSSYQNVWYYSGKPGPPNCHPGTRITIMQEIQTWSESSQPFSSSSNSSIPILWLHGLPRTGKSAIALTMSEKWYEEGRLAASYFFSRESLVPDERELVIPTIALQMSKSLGVDFRALLGEAVTLDPSFSKQSLKVQADTLIVKPLKKALALRRSSSFYTWPFGLFYNPASTPHPARYPRALVIDGLDEVLFPDTQLELLQSLLPLTLDQNLPIRLLVSSRSTSTLHRVFNSSPLNASRTQLDLNNHPSTTTDMEIYLLAEFEKIKHERAQIPPVINDSWPPAGTVASLVERFNGNFELATRFMRVLKEPFWDPQELLHSMMDGYASKVYHTDVFTTALMISWTRRQVLRIMLLLYRPLAPTPEDLAEMVAWYDSLSY